MSTLVLIGRTNVGKSSIFNVLSNSKLKAISSDVPELTRDCNFSSAAIGELGFTIVDTPGVENLDSVPKFMRQVIADSDLIGFVVEAKSGLSLEDFAIARGLRKLHKPVVLLVNKCDFPKSLDKEYYKIWDSRPICLSAMHNQGMDELALRLIECGFTSHVSQSADLKIAIIGRPNTGKSTFVNSILGVERLNVSSQAGTTRDSIREELCYRSKRLSIIDTAGLRRRSRIREGLESLCVASSVQAIDLADITVLMIECSDSLQKQDLQVLQIARKKRKCFVLVVNKIDLVPKSELKGRKEQLNAQIHRFIDAPILYISALSRAYYSRVLDACLDVYQRSGTSISTGRLNSWLKLATEEVVRPRLVSGKSFKAKYCVCLNTRPFLIKVFCNSSEPVPESYRKYLANSFRKHFAVYGSDVKFVFCARRDRHINE